MRKVFLVFIALSVVMFSCKTSKKAQKSKASVAEEVVIQEEEPVKEVVKSKEFEKTPEPEVPIVVRTEEVKVVDTNDRPKGEFAFYVIIGSFSKMENAMKFKGELASKGFSCTLLSTESGMTRVAVDQSNSEQEARNRVLSIRTMYPEHKDVWLLKKK